jgi:hypothetical protein
VPVGGVVGQAAAEFGQRFLGFLERSAYAPSSLPRALLPRKQPERRPALSTSTISAAP